MMTFWAPASRCAAALSRSVKRPVDSITISAPSSFHGRLAGSRSASTRSSSPSITRPFAPTVTSPAKRPSTESYFSRCAIVAASLRSFTPTKSKSSPRCLAARKKLRPIRPNPLIPILTPIVASLRGCGNVILIEAGSQARPEGRSRSAPAEVAMVDADRQAPLAEEPASSSATTTDRCRPPVHPTATVR